ncbi:MAG TPA: DegT/DnrJ/EryC1/StrS aminotransferase family protein [Candidatus Paceibacterota bacterium]|nr:DegT/DnrJ/EryC1/StrS aminotransferase family protein [Candidatus Paceibacterota bacterium]
MAKQNKNPAGLKVGVGSLTIGPLAKKLINQTLDKNRLSYGDLTMEFENKFAQLHGARFGIFTVSGTSALQVALNAMKNIHGWKDGDEVLVPAITFIATSNIVISNNLKPVFVDIDPRTYNIDPSKIEAKITKRTRAIIPVHLFGQPAEMDTIMAIARKRKLKVIADSCETMDAHYKGKPLGAWGDIVCFSTYVAHILITGVGGLMITNDPRYATAMRSLMNHGRDTIYYNIDQDDKLGSKKALFTMVNRRFSFIDVGYSYRLTELEAALGLEGLQKMKATVRGRKKNAAYLTKALSSFANDLQLPFTPKGSDNVYFCLPIVIRKNSKIKREDLVTFLEERGIETRYMMPLLSQPVYRKLFPGLEKKYPVAQWIEKNGFYIGCHQDLSMKELRYVASAFEEFFNKK